MRRFRDSYGISERELFWLGKLFGLFTGDSSLKKFCRATREASQVTFSVQQPCAQLLWGSAELTLLSDGAERLRSGIFVRGSCAARRALSSPSSFSSPCTARCSAYLESQLCEAAAKAFPHSESCVTEAELRTINCFRTCSFSLTGSVLPFSIF